MFFKHKRHPRDSNYSTLTFKLSNWCKVKITGGVNDQGFVGWMNSNKKLTDAFENLGICGTSEKILNNFQMKTGDR